MIGGGDWNMARIIPDLARALDANQTLIIRNPNAIRPWQHVLDPLFGYLLLGAKMHQDPIRYPGDYNFGPDSTNELTVEELIKLSIKTWGSGTYKVKNEKTQKHEAGILKLDTTKARTLLNWSPMLNAKQTISWTIDWYKTGSDQQANKTRKQVQDYFNTL